MGVYSGEGSEERGIESDHWLVKRIRGTDKLVNFIVTVNKSVIVFY